MSFDHERGARTIIATGSICEHNCGGWYVKKRYRGSGNHVKATHRGLSCDCQPSYYHNIRCQHILAVEMYLKERGETVILPEQFEEETKPLNSHLAEYNLVLERRHKYSKIEGWFVEVVEDVLPITEWRHSSDITTPIEMILDRARETKTKIYIKIDHTPYDYESDWVVHKGKPLGTERVIALLEKANFSKVGRSGKIDIMMFDPTLPVDPYEGIKGREHLERFIDGVEMVFRKTLSQDDFAEFLVEKRELLEKLRE